MQYIKETFQISHSNNLQNESQGALYRIRIIDTWQKEKEEMKQINMKRVEVTIDHCHRLD